jgi:hypothetical protein
MPETYPVIEKWRKDNSDRLVKNLYLSEKEWNQIPDGAIKDKMRWLVKTIFTTIREVAANFYRDKGLTEEPNIAEILHICKYEKGGSIGFHFDAERNGALLYTIAIYWNDEYTGGELGFQVVDATRKTLFLIPDEEKDIFKIKPEANSVLIFPATAPYFHSSLQLESGFKYFTSAAIFVDGFDHMNPEHIEKYRLEPEE